MASSPRLLHPLDIIAFFVSNGGRCTNNELVKNFRGFVSCPEVADFNKSQLKAVMRHVGRVRRQGSSIRAGEGDYLVL